MYAPMEAAARAVIDVFDGNGAPSGPNYLLFSGADRLTDSLQDRSGVGCSPTPHAPVLRAPQRALDRKLWGIMVVVRKLLGTSTDMYVSMEALAHAVSAFAHISYRPLATPGRPPGREPADSTGLTTLRRPAPRGARPRRPSGVAAMACLWGYVPSKNIPAGGDL